MQGVIWNRRYKIEKNMAQRCKKLRQRRKKREKK